MASERFERTVLAMGDKVPAWGSWDYPASLIVKPLVDAFELSRDCLGCYQFLVQACWDSALLCVLQLSSLGCQTSSLIFQC